MSKSFVVLRVARPTNHLSRIVKMYEHGLGLQKLSEFHNHDEFDGVILGHHNYPYHLEFTYHHGSNIEVIPHKDSLLVFYMPEKQLFTLTCANLEAAGFIAVESFNPYWEEHGKTYEDIEGYRLVLSGLKWEK